MGNDLPWRMSCPIEKRPISLIIHRNGRRQVAVVWRPIICSAELASYVSRSNPADSSARLECGAEIGGQIAETPKSHDFIVLRSIHQVPINGATYRTMQPCAGCPLLLMSPYPKTGPVVAIASARTANTRTNYPLSEISDVCEEQPLWLHGARAYPTKLFLCLARGEKSGHTNNQTVIQADVWFDKSVSGLIGTRRQ